MCTILTASGKLLNPFTLRPDEVSVRDIAHALSNIPRWNGHTIFHISVAQHSVLVSQLARDLFGADLATQKAALLHDAPEYLLCDIPSTLKRHPIMQEYCELHDRVASVVFEAVALGAYDASLIAQAHDIATALEVRDLTTRPDLFTVAGLPKKRLEPWKPQTAKVRFLQHFTRLNKLIDDAQKPNAA